jgi:hypothetical protein
VAIQTCRTAALGGHVDSCDDCGYLRVAYNSCRNRHCPKCQAAAAKAWLAERKADLLPVGYFHVVFTLPAEIADIAWQNKAAVYDLLFRAASETMMTIAADPKHLGARIGITAVLHTWGSAMTHHPHVHMIVPGGGISIDGRRWISSRPAFLLPVRVLGALFRRLFLIRLNELHDAGKLVFFGAQADLADRRRFLRHLAQVRKKRWVVYSKLPFAGPEAVLAYLSLYTHRVAISNGRLIAFDEAGVTFRYKDYRRTCAQRQQVMTLDAREFMRRFLLHVLPHGFHRIRHYGLFASATRKANIARVRELLAASTPTPEPLEAAEPPAQLPPCPCCGGRMRIIETFECWMQPRAPPRHLAATGRRRDPAQFIPTQCRRQVVRQTTHRARFASPVSSGTPIPAAIVTRSDQRLRTLAASASTSSRSAPPMKPSVQHDRAPRHGQNTKSP